ncbi:hypothetical protein GCM10008905_32760 [Clostridium malenominatum]|uniref:Sortase family protein n=1 Tax=Clostridium malenominatum TaxID=1539 RepID=A0ABN1J7B5_9CLOT
MKRKIISTIIIVIGVFVIAYPKMTEAYVDYKQQKLIREWNESLSIIDEGSINYQDDNEIILIEEQNTETVEDNKENEAYKEAEEKKKENERKLREEYIKKNMEGMLIIKKINLNLPILKGAIEENLKISVASIEHTGKAGQEGNYAIAGHRSHTYGRNFNRLDEVEIGDIIEIDKGESQYKYVVVEKLYVKPEETWVLNSNKKNKEITLVTCHPMIKPTQRLIIKGNIIE